MDILDDVDALFNECDDIIAKYRKWDQPPSVTEVTSRSPCKNSLSQKYSFSSDEEDTVSYTKSSPGQSKTDTNGFNDLDFLTVKYQQDLRSQGSSVKVGK